MAGSKTTFEEYLSQEVQRGQSVYFPIKSSFARRMMVRKARCKDLHPNPDDEFCMPEIGPNYTIIADYQQQYLNAISNSQPYYSGEPLIVERVHPSGYRIINGHHRWAAAMQLGQTSIPIRIINLTHEEDVKDIIANSTHTKRVALDLDEVVFHTDANSPPEQLLSFPWRLLYPYQLRLGVPALFHYLTSHGYDIWLYSSRYHSADYIHSYFRHYHVKIDGVVTAVGNHGRTAGIRLRKLETLIAASYRYTVHIDTDTVLCFHRGSKEYTEYPLGGSSSGWSQSVLAAMERLDAESAKGGTPE